MKTVFNGILFQIQVVWLCLTKILLVLNGGRRGMMTLHFWNAGMDAIVITTSQLQGNTPLNHARDEILLVSATNTVISNQPYLLLYNLLMDPSISPFFNPKGVVIVGASADPGKLGYFVARNMLRSGYGGALHFVNLKGGELFGRPIHRNAAHVPDPVDLAVLIVPAPVTPAALKDVAGRGIRAVIISSGGFREAGPEGAALESECLEIAHKYDLRLIGPNCIGLIDNHLPLDTSFVSLPPPPKGNLALISQSGAVCGLISDWAQEQGVGFSRMLSLGNQADLTETDMLAGVVEDGNTHAITFYIESIRDGRRFVEAAARAVQIKPLVAMKVGRSLSGQRAAASHTGALAGADSAYQAAFRRSGVQQATTIEEMFDWAVALAECPLPHGRNIAILTNAGGPGVIASDAIEINGLTLAKFTPATFSALSALLPSAASLANPVDILGGATSGMYADCLSLLLADPGVDGVLVIIPPPPVDTAEMDAEVIIPLIQASAKPVLVALMGGATIRIAAGLFRQARIPEYRFPERAVSALAALVRRADFLGKAQESPTSWKDINALAAHETLAGALPGSFLDPLAAEHLMAAYHIPVSSVRLARTEAEAARIARELGFPVVLKVASPDISHKSDLGGVLLNIQTPEEVRFGFRTVTERARRAQPRATVEGVHIQRMLTGGQEVIIGVRRDPQFGALAMFGSGGVEVEGLKDIAFALAPLLPSEADDLLQHTWAGRKLAGFRNIPPGDEGAVKEILQRLAQLAADHPQIAEIEINPLLVLAPGQGATALDVRVKLG
jgi:acetyl coenzyme A synthetase (ADP forming)-like protein